MLVVMHRGATEEQIDHVCEVIRGLGYAPHPIPGGQRTAIGVTGNKNAEDADHLSALPGVVQVIRVSKAYKLVSREVKAEDTVVPVGRSRVGTRELVVMAGPCSIESREQALTIARHVQAAGATVFRGGAFKPRSSPYAFQGLGQAGLDILREVRDETGLAVVTEVMDPRDVDRVEAVADMVQVGARSMQNFALLKRLGASRKPVLLKRGMAATLDELLMSAEYILNEGNYQVALCERGVRTFVDHTRNQLDLSAVPQVKESSHLPIICDPSHGTGVRSMVIPLARACAAVGADGLMVEVHHDPDHALSDGFQSLLPAQFSELMTQLRALAPVLGRAIGPAA